MRLFLCFFIEFCVLNFYVAVNEGFMHFHCFDVQAIYWCLIRWGPSYRDSGSCYFRLKNTRSWLLGWIMLERRLLFTNCTWVRLLLPIQLWEAMLKNLCTRTFDLRCSQSINLLCLLSTLFFFSLFTCALCLMFYYIPSIGDS